MRRPRLEACYFGAGPADAWPRMARILEATARRHCPDWDIHVRPITPDPPRVSAINIPSLARNTEKMDEWYRIVEAAPEGDRILLCDADMFVNQPLAPVWDLSFDIAYTTKPSKFPFNSGVVFLRVNDRSRAFVRDWWAENVRMLGDKSYHQPWRAKYGGINQAALGAILNRGGLEGLEVLQLPCRDWNCEDSSWSTYDPKRTRLIHVKSALRRALFQGERSRPEFIALVREWRRLEAAVNQAADQAARSA